ncbi:lysophospholipid acyltransferase family protein [Brevibacterium album]|uniref:lysophospholipid acyltransferase family protein n=1 Tax=Brevibacterium album TaxID=417948 RepID=UPI0004061C7C|nr:lysophospholipid acyltransferase family protein [Brevibacterium album]
MFYWFLKRVLVGPLVRLLFRPWARGVDNVPDSGPVILAANHLSFMDSVFVPLALRRPVVYLAKDEYFRRPGVRGALTRRFFEMTGQLPMDRAGGAGSEASLGLGEDVLESGSVLGIYPEGTRSPDGRLHRGHTGVARLALATGAPVVPVAVVGTDRLRPAGARLPRLRRVGTVFGEPLRLGGPDPAAAADRFALRRATDRVMDEIMRLSGQEYTGVYAAPRARLLAAAPGAFDSSGNSDTPKSLSRGSVHRLR